MRVPAGGLWLNRLIAFLALTVIPVLPVRAEEHRLRAAMHIELQILDPHITTATVTRAFGYMVYDTLVAMDSHGIFRPQMLESWSVSDDRLTWTFTLRPGLTWHDGAPVTPEDCVASLRRWAKSDAFGKRMMAAVAGIRIIDDRRFAFDLSRPFAFVIEAIGKPNANVPVIMPARVAAAGSAARGQGASLRRGRLNQCPRSSGTWLLNRRLRAWAKRLEVRQQEPVGNGRVRAQPAVARTFHVRGAGRRGWLELRG